MLDAKLGVRFGGTTDPVDAEALLGRLQSVAVLDHARSAMISLTMARRATGGDDTIDTPYRPVNGAPYRG